MSDIDLFPYIMTFFLGVCICICLLAFNGHFETIVQELDLNEDVLARYHVLKYYPEYENCSIDYQFNMGEGCLSCRIIPGVKVFCDVKDNRDGMIIMNEDNPTIEIEFKDVDLNDIIKDILKDYEGGKK